MLIYSKHKLNFMHYLVNKPLEVDINLQQNQSHKFITFFNNLSLDANSRFSQKQI